MSAIRRDPNSPVAVIIVNWNGVADTLEVLRELEGIDGPSLRIIVVDNGSSDDSVDVLRRDAPHVELVETGGWFEPPTSALVTVSLCADSGMRAGPDCPQFYFLSGRQNPTPQCYDLFRAYQLGGQSELETELKHLIEARDIQLVIHNQNPEFSKPYSPDFISWLESWGERSPSVGSGRFQIFIKNGR